MSRAWVGQQRPHLEVGPWLEVDNRGGGGGAQEAQIPANVGQPGAVVGRRVEHQAGRRVQQPAVVRGGALIRALRQHLLYEDAAHAAPG